MPTPDDQILTDEQIAEIEAVNETYRVDWRYPNQRERIDALCRTVKQLRASDQHNYDLWLTLKERYQHQFTEGRCAKCGIAVQADHDGTDCVAYLQSQLEQLRAEHEGLKSQRDKWKRKYRSVDIND